MRYSAFISYNHRDRAHAIRLHRSLERYRVPRRLRGRNTPFGSLGPRLPPVFRDREELAASADLAHAVEAALDGSATLVVLCSPGGARSRWVNEEIRSFARMGRANRIRCLIVGGEPYAADPADECMPPALFETGAEPLAADLRPGQDGWPAARLKVLAGILDVPYDELRQREAQRRQRRLAIVAAVASALVVLFAGLAILAWIARAEAVRQRDVARQRTVTAERTVAFVQSMFAVADPDEAKGSTVTAREIVTRGATRIRTELGDEPAVRAALATTLTEVFGSLGLYHEAGDLARWGLRVHHDDPGLLARQIGAYGEAHAHLGNERAAAAAFRRVLAICAGPARCEAGLVPQTYTDLGQAALRGGDLREAERWALAAYAGDRAEDPRSRFIARDLENLAKIRRERDDPAGARALLQRALALRLRTDGATSRGVSDVYNELGAVAYGAGDRAGAERFFAARLRTDERVLGPLHPDIAVTLNNVGRMMIERRAFAAARPLLDRALRIDLAAHDAMWADDAFVYANRGLATAGMGDHAAAERDLRRALAIAHANHHRTEAPVMADLAALLCDAGRAREALPLLAAAAPIMTEAYPDVPWRRAWIDVVQGGCLLGTGRHAAGERLIRAGGPIVAAAWPPGTLYGHETARRAARFRMAP